MPPENGGEAAWERYCKTIRDAPKGEPVWLTLYRQDDGHVGKVAKLEIDRDRDPEEQLLEHLKKQGHRGGARIKVNVRGPQKVEHGCMTLECSLPEPDPVPAELPRQVNPVEASPAQVTRPITTLSEAVGYVRDMRKELLRCDDCDKYPCECPCADCGQSPCACDDAADDGDEEENDGKPSVGDVFAEYITSEKGMERVDGLLSRVDDFLSAGIDRLANGPHKPAPPAAPARPAQQFVPKVVPPATPGTGTGGAK